MIWIKFILVDIINTINQDQKMIKIKINYKKLIFNFNKTNKFKNQQHNKVHFIFCLIKIFKILNKNKQFMFVEEMIMDNQDWDILNLLSKISKK